MNIIMWQADNAVLSVVLPRRKHRPDCYTATGDAQYIISPGAVDMGGLIITPREQDFRRVTPKLILDIYRELSLTPEQVQQVKTAIANWQSAVSQKPKANSRHPRS